MSNLKPEINELESRQDEVQGKSHGDIEKRVQNHGDLKNGLDPINEVNLLETKRPDGLVF